MVLLCHFLCYQSCFIAEMADFVSLPVLFQSVYQPMSGGQYESMEEEQVWTLIEKIDTCHDLVRREALFSKNETLEDVHTESMKVII
ncbi:hypothetical protein EON65_26040 [archaeon]|nr:MAG: hypothetical protein EON65_26040 [archaeon]